MVLFRTSYPTDFSVNVQCGKLSMHTTLQKNALDLHVFPLKPQQAMRIRGLFADTILLFSSHILYSVPFCLEFAWQLLEIFVTIMTNFQHIHTLSQ